MKRRDFTDGSLATQFYFSAANSIVETPCQGYGEGTTFIIHDIFGPNATLSLGTSKI